MHNVKYLTIAGLAGLTVFHVSTGQFSIAINDVLTLAGALHLTHYLGTIGQPVNVAIVPPVPDPAQGGGQP